MAYVELGLTITQIGTHLYHGEIGNAIQDVVTWAASEASQRLLWSVATRLPLVFTPATTVVLAAFAVGAVAYALDGYIDGKKKCQSDPTEDFKPTPTESPTAGYKVEYYDPIILDLNGDGVGTVSKFGHHGAMFDHDGNGVATATGWVAVNDEYYQKAS